MSDFRTDLPQVLAVCIKNIILVGEFSTWEQRKLLKAQLTSLAFGMTLGFPTVLIPALQAKPNETSTSDLILNESQISWISSINLICVPLGCIFSGSFTAFFGRRRAMQLVCVPLFFSWILFYFAQHVLHLYLALCMSGFTGKRNKRRAWLSWTNLFLAHDSAFQFHCTFIQVCYFQAECSRRQFWLTSQKSRRRNFEESLLQPEASALSLESSPNSWWGFTSNGEQ